MRNKLTYFLFSILLATLCFSASCTLNDPIKPNESELITTLICTLTPESGGTPIKLTFRDLDGDGGKAPVITTSNALSKDSKYTATISLSNESVDPAVDITTEVQLEAKDHQFFFEPSDSLNLTVTYKDKESGGFPIGLTSTFTTTSASKGSLKITLRHLPKKSAEGVEEGKIKNAAGETDIEVSFDLEIQ